jgi:hypothetical protein
MGSPGVEGDPVALFLQPSGDLNCIFFSPTDPVEVFYENSDMKSFPADNAAPLSS